MSHWRLPEVLAGPHRLLSRVELEPSNTGDRMPLEFTRWQLSFEETRAPRAELKVDIPTPADLATWLSLDPRVATRVRLWVGHRIDGVPDRLLVADLGLRLNSETDPEGMTILTAAGGEARVIDNAPSAITSTLTGSTCADAIETIVQASIPGAVVNVVGATGGAVTIDAPNYEDKWATVDDLADRIGDADVFDDGLGVWWIQPRPQVAGSAVWSFVDGVDGARVSHASTLDREAWANRVVLTHRWRDSADVEHTIQGVRSITSGPFAATAGNVRAVRIDRTTSISQSGANTAAASLVKRWGSRGRSYTIRHVAIPWLRPGMTVEVSPRPGVVSRHLVSSVMMDSSGWGETTTRYPDNATVGA